MTALGVVVAGLVLFVLASGWLGAWLRTHPTRENAEWSSRIMHALFFALLNLLPLVLFISPGIFALDPLLGLPPLAPAFTWRLAGIVLILPGAYLLAVTNKALRALGSGANAFRLTTRVVHGDIYRLTRNPMSLGFYLWVVAVGFLTTSTTFTLIAAFGIVPAHLFFLLWFESAELPLRLGPSYEEYRRRTPFLFPRFRPEST